MHIEKSIAALEVTEDDVVILRERHAVMVGGTVTDDEGNEFEGMVEKTHWFEQRTIREGDDYSDETAKVQAVCAAVFD